MKKLLMIISVILLFGVTSCKKDVLEHSMDLVIESETPFGYDIYIIRVNDTIFNSHSPHTIRCGIADVHCNTGDNLQIFLTSSNVKARLASQYTVYENDKFSMRGNEYVLSEIIE